MKEGRFGGLSSCMVVEGKGKGNYQNCEDTHRFSVFSFLVSFCFVQIPNLHNHEPRDLYKQEQVQVYTKNQI